MARIPVDPNSKLIDDCGYYYDGFDCEAGGAALQRAFAEHDHDLKSHRDRARRLLRKLDPESEVNVRIYTEAIDALYREAR